MANSYGFDPVAWSVDGGRHRGELLRVLAYAATSGSEGIVSPQDCRVRQLTTPGTQIAIDTGATLIRNRSANVRNQTYVANGRTETRLDVTPTTSAGPRRDLVVVRVEDPQYSPWPTPALADRATYQYVKPFIIENVPANTMTAKELNLGYSAVELARLDIPASTSTITNSMIKDLRKVAQPRRQRHVKVYTPGPGPVILGPSATRGWFPQTNISIACPEWATRLQMVVSYTGLLFEGDMTGHTRAEYGWAPGDVPGEGDFEGLPCIATQYTGLHYLPGGEFSERKTIMIGGDMALPASYRGKSHFVRTGTQVNPGKIYRLIQDDWLTVVVDLEFIEVAE